MIDQLVLFSVDNFLQLKKFYDKLKINWAVE